MGEEGREWTRKEREPAESPTNIRDNGPGYRLSPECTPEIRES